MSELVARLFLPVLCFDCVSSVFHLSSLRLIQTVSVQSCSSSLSMSSRALLSLFHISGAEPTVASSCQCDVQVGHQTRCFARKSLHVCPVSFRLFSVKKKPCCARCVSSCATLPSSPSNAPNDRHDLQDILTTRLVPRFPRRGH